MSRLDRIRQSLALPRYQAEKSAAETTQHGRRKRPGPGGVFPAFFSLLCALPRFGRSLLSGVAALFVFQEKEK